MSDASSSGVTAKAVPQGDEMIYKYECGAVGEDGLHECQAVAYKYAFTGALKDRYSCYGEETPQSCFAAVRSQEGLPDACFQITDTWSNSILKWGGLTYRFNKVACENAE